jgi:uncharacterized ferritin-like protein (DUF455 family)
LSGPLDGSLIDRAIAVLQTAAARDKAAAARRLAADWRDGALTLSSGRMPPDRPARPESPPLRPPREVPRRRVNANPTGRIALLHALAHIELNAIDLAVDIVARFAATGPGTAFADDWIAVADDEARHFLMLDDRLRTLGAMYGDLPAHDGLWQASMETAHDLLARLAIVPMVLEARGLDVTPGMIDKLTVAGDTESADILRIIHDDEIGHVAAGRRWFDALCEVRELDPAETWRELVRKHFKGGLKPPFNAESRAKAGLASSFYEPLLADG